MTCGIYMIRNTLTNHSYIGSSVDVDRRIKVHIKLLQKGKHYNRQIQNAWDVCGENNFTWHIVEETDRDNLLSSEQHYIDLLKPSYNQCRVAGSWLGFHHTTEAKSKIAAGHRGNKYLSASALKSKSDKTKKMWQEGRYDKVDWSEVMSRRPHSHTPYTLSEETRQKMSDSHKSMWHDSEYVAEHTRDYHGRFKSNKK